MKIQKVLRLTSLLFFLICFAADADNFKRPPECKDFPTIPINVDGALSVLKEYLPAEELKDFRKLKEDEAVGMSHFALGLTIRNCWGLWADTALVKYFNQLGIDHPDDMSSIITTSLWRDLNQVPIDLTAQINDSIAEARIAKSPDPKSNPHCTSGIHTVASWTTDSPLVKLRGVHMGKCCPDERIWAYHADRGWFIPDMDQVQAFREGTETAYDPCK